MANEQQLVKSFGFRDASFKRILHTQNFAYPVQVRVYHLTLPGVRDSLVGLVVRRPPRERKIPGSNPACAGIFSGSSHTYDLKIGTPVATQPGAWRYRVSIL